MSPFVIPAIIAVIIMQVLLSQCASKYWGLILPAISFCISMILCIWFILFSGVGWTDTIMTEDGRKYVVETEEEAQALKESLDTEIVSETIVKASEKDFDIKTYAVIVLRLFLSVNVVTIILWLIYRIQRKRL